MQTVILQKCDGYEQPRLAEKIDSILSRLTEGWSLTGSQILVKPNLISSKAPLLACSRPEFILAAVTWLTEQHVRVRVGDSPAFGSAGTVIARLGIGGQLKKLGVEIVDFKSPVKHELHEGVDIEIAREALDNDYLLNLPRLKAHNQMYVTGSVKNLFGCVVGVRKAMLHMVHGKTHDPFASILLQIPALLPPNATLIDAIEVMHRSGPVHGESKRLDVIAGAVCPVSLDSALLAMLELPPGASPLWLAAEKVGHPGCIADTLRYPDLSPAELHGLGFEPPDSLDPVRFSLFRFAMGGLKRLRLAFQA